MDSLSNDRIEVLNLNIFKAVERPDEALKFFEGQRDQLLSRGVKGVKSASKSWLNNPSVFLMALYAGKEIVGGTRLHVYHKDYDYPFIEAVKQTKPKLMSIMEKPSHPAQAEGCGLWIETRLSGYGLGEFLSRVLITTAHTLGLNHIYGICPRHTMDAFRKIGFYFNTLNDQIAKIPYPSTYTSYLIECEVAELRYTFSSERKIITTWLEAPFQSTTSKGSLGDLIVKLNGFPEAISPEEFFSKQTHVMTSKVGSDAVEAKKES